MLLLVDILPQSSPGKQFKDILNILNHEKNTVQSVSFGDGGEVFTAQPNPVDRICLLVLRTK